MRLYFLALSLQLVLFTNLPCCGLQKSSMPQRDLSLGKYRVSSCSLVLRPLIFGKDAYKILFSCITIYGSDPAGFTGRIVACSSFDLLLRKYCERRALNLWITRRSSYILICSPFPHIFASSPSFLFDTLAHRNEASMHSFFPIILKITVTRIRTRMIEIIPAANLRAARYFERNKVTTVMIISLQHNPAALYEKQAKLCAR